MERKVKIAAKAQTTRLQQITPTYRYLDCNNENRPAYTVQAVAVTVLSALTFTDPHSGWVSKIAMLIALVACDYSIYKRIASS